MTHLCFEQQPILAGDCEHPDRLTETKNIQVHAQFRAATQRIREQLAG